jgi:molybdopterin/thiamine biosynthesis adenylyltransferase/ribosomal protein S27E
VIVVGAGGNIGSHLVRHLGRMPAIGRILLVDPDRYELSNLFGQDIEPRDCGRHKVAVQAAALRRINPALKVETAAARVETLPLGALRGDVILACLDSRASRQSVNEAAWRLRVPWIDAGVEGGGLLARVNVYVPGKDAPCLECAWDERDYAALEQTYPCSSGPSAPATGAPSGLGALAASLQAIECGKLLAGGPGRVAAGRQVLLDAAWHKHYVTEFRRNPSCRFDHGAWSIRRLECDPARVTLAGLLCSGTPLSVPGRRFVRTLRCPGCGRSRRVFRLEPSAGGSCRRCGRAMLASGTEVVHALDGTLPERILRRPLRALGLRNGEVISLGEAHFEIAGESA